MVRAGVAYAGHCPDCLFLALFFNVFQWGRGYCFYFGVEGEFKTVKGTGPQCVPNDAPRSFPKSIPPPTTHTGFVCVRVTHFKTLFS